MGDLADCIVVGAGPAGLSAALFLARYRRPTITFHHASPRNLYSHGVHGFLGHHGIPPAELLSRGQAEVRQHGGVVLEACVTTVEKTADGHFRVTAVDPAGGTHHAVGRRLLLATGLKDLTPTAPGWLDFYGSSVFHCPDCDGFEVSGLRVAALGCDRAVLGLARSLLTWTDRIVVLTDGPADWLTDDDRAELADRAIAIVLDRVVGLEGRASERQLERIRLADGGAVSCDALFFHLGTVPAADLHEQLGCRLDPESGLVSTDDAQETSVVGVYAAGDLTPRSQLAIVAAAEGAMAGISIHRSLVLEERPHRRPDEIATGHW